MAKFEILVKGRSRSRFQCRDGLAAQHFLFVLVLFQTCVLHAQPRGKIPPLANSITYSSSSTMPNSYGLSYRASNAGDGSLSTWWSPSPNDRTTCWLQLNFSSARTINYIDIHGGSHYPSFGKFGDLYPMNLRIRLARLEFSNGDTETIELEDFDDVQTIFIGRRTTRYVRIRPLRYYQATRWNDPCISYFDAGLE